MDNMFEREYWEQKHREAYPEQYAAPPYLGGGPVNAPMPPVQSPPPRHWLGSEGIGNMEIGDSLPIPRDFAPTQLPEMRGPNPIPGQLTVDEMQMYRMAPQMYKGPQTLGDMQMYPVAPREIPLEGNPTTSPYFSLTPEEMMRLRQMLLEQRSRGLLGE